MAAARRPKPKPPGRNIPDAERGTVKLQLRVPEDVAAAIRERGESDPKGASGYVTRLVREAER